MPEFKHLENDENCGLPLFSTSQGWPTRRSDKFKTRSLRKAAQRLQKELGLKPLPKPKAKP